MAGKRVSALAGLKEEMQEKGPDAVPLDSPGRSASVARAKAGRPATSTERSSNVRDQRKALTVYFPPEVSKELRRLAVEEDTTLQALVGEAIDLLRRNRGQHPFGAR